MIGQMKEGKREQITEIELMKSVMATAIQDYMHGIGISGLTKKEETIKGRARSAHCWITDMGRSSSHYVFGFIFICKIIGLDPDRFRTKILEMKTIKDIEDFRERYVRM